MVCWNVWASSERYSNSGLFTNNHFSLSVDKTSGVWITSERLVSATRFLSEICKCRNCSSTVRGANPVLCCDLGPSARFSGGIHFVLGEGNKGIGSSMIKQFYCSSLIFVRCHLQYIVCISCLSHVVYLKLKITSNLPAIFKSAEKKPNQNSVYFENVDLVIHWYDSLKNNSNTKVFLEDHHWKTE